MLLAGAASLALQRVFYAEGEKKGTGLPVGVASASYGTRFAEDRDPNGVRDTLGFLRFCRERGAAGVQTGITVRDEAYSASIRRFLDESGMWLEGAVRLPRDRADVERFAVDVRAAKAAGATVLRTAMLNGRRYEAFATTAEFERFRQSSTESVLLAEPVVARERVRLAVENHKDYRMEEFVALLKRVGSEYVGATVDTGNNLALLEEPLETARALAPYAFSAHLKDMAVDECPEGFLLAEVPFGDGFLDLPLLVKTLRQSRPDVRFHVEMITRDPLVIPCLTDRYRTTLGQSPEKILALVRRHQADRPLPRTTGLSVEARLKLEDENVRRCIDYARKRLAG
jgi:sugar phosphate isomerase/epimerase